MVEQLKNIPKLILEWWKKFSRRQKTLIISITSVVIVSLVILIVVLTRPQMITLVTCESVKEANQVKTLLDDNSIGNEVSDDGLVVRINKNDKSAAVMLLGANNIPADEYDLENVFNGGFSTTEADKSKRYRLYLEEKIEEHISTLDAVASAKVSLSIPEDNGTIIASKEPTYASILLKLDSELDEAAASSLAKYVATAVGNENTNSITIIDTNSNVLFAGDDSTSIVGAAGSQLAIKSKAEKMVKGEVKDVMLGSNVYDNVEVGLNLEISFDTKNVTDHRYYVEDGRTEGFKDSESIFESEATGGVAGVPGTYSNGDNNSYVIEDDNITSSSTTEKNTDYALNETVTETTTPAGVIIPEESSISVVASKYRVIKEDDLKRQGLLDDKTFDDYILENGEKVKLEVDDDFYSMVANATGISADNISIVAYEIPFFEPSEESGFSWTDIAQYVLMALILLLLGFVVFRSTRPAEVTEMEPELSVETLLESTRATEKLEDIDINEKSETRIMIEKFVDENPEAVAILLRNWLNEDWE